jgi:hypothetical protein
MSVLPKRDNGQINPSRVLSINSRTSPVVSHEAVSIGFLRKDAAPRNPKGRHAVVMKNSHRLM